MSHRKTHSRQHGHAHPSPPPPATTGPDAAAKPPELELVVKAATSGSLEAACNAIHAMPPTGVALSIIHRGIGEVNKTDLLNATTGSRLIIGFEVGVQPHLAELCREQNIEIRLYDIIYRLLADLKETAASLTEPTATETVTGSAKVVALFKSCRHGIILGCEVHQGRLQLGDHFRVIAAMGPVYTGRIESLHIERNTVKQASAGQQAGLKIHGFQQAHIGDLVEAFKSERSSHRPWQPSGLILTR